MLEGTATQSAPAIHLTKVDKRIMDCECPSMEAIVDDGVMGRPWLRSARMKHDWPRNVITFRRGGKKIWIHTIKGRIPDKATAPVYAEGVNMLEGLTEEEADTFLQENPTLVPLYEIDVVKEAEPYQWTEQAAIVELGRAREALERELAVSQ
jgi:hypothetical protein